MERQRREANGNGNNSGVWTAVGAVAGIGALIGGAYWIAQRKTQNETEPNLQQGQIREQRTERSPANGSTATTSTFSGTLDNITSRLSSLLESATVKCMPEQRSVPRSAVPMYPDITNLNSLLSDIYVRFIQLKNEDFQDHYNVFMEIFFRLHESMKQVDPYYNCYSSTISFAGSHYDRLRIKKPDEFDMDIVISLPLNFDINDNDPRQSDLILEPKGAGFIQLKTGVQFQKLPYRDGANWLVNKTAFEWQDERGYLVRSKFINWFKSVVVKALNNNGWNYYVAGIPYRTRLSESGPAVTLIIESQQRGFRLDVDLVPALRFPESRWPPCSGYRVVPPNARRNYWYLVPKPNKSVVDEIDQTRSWRIALQDQEREIMKNLQNCKQVIRLLKMLRDALCMKKIASYYVKTLFLWQIVKKDDPTYWRKSPAVLFKIMVTEFYNALVSGSIPYFWNSSNNLLAGIEREYLTQCAARLAKLMDVLEQPTKYKQVAKFLLSPDDFLAYNAQYLHI